MRLASTLAAGAVLVSFAAAQAPTDPRESSDPERGTIAVVRRDGLMIPFASFRGTRWVSEWPGALRMLELPIDLESVPERWWGGWTPDAWQFWPAAGAARPLTPRALQLFPIQCAPRIGVRTDHRPVEAPPFPPIEPYPKDGLAATTGVRVEPIAAVDAGSGDRAALAVALLRDFDVAEDRELALIQSIFRHPVARRGRQAQPVQIESWHRTVLDDGTTVSYVEAVRAYPPRPEDEGCGLETLFSGWVTQEKDGQRPRVDLGARVTYCDRVGATRFLPLGRIRLRDHVFWVAEISGREAEWYVVAQIAPGRPKYLVEYLAGTKGDCR